MLIQVQLVLTKLIDRSSVNRPTASNAIAIQDLVNGFRFKSDINFFPLLKMMSDILRFIDTPIIDESILEYEYHEYEHITGTSAMLGLLKYPDDFFKAQGLNQL